jgi:hypothetical protein
VREPHGPQTGGGGRACRDGLALHSARARTGAATVRGRSRTRGPDRSAQGAPGQVPAAPAPAASAAPAPTLQPRVSRAASIEALTIADAELIMRALLDPPTLEQRATWSDVAEQIIAEARHPPRGDVAPRAPIWSSGRLPYGRRCGGPRRRPQAEKTNRRVPSRAVLTTKDIYSFMGLYSRAGRWLTRQPWTRRRGRSLLLWLVPCVPCTRNWASHSFSPFSRLPMSPGCLLTIWPTGSIYHNRR